MQMLFRCSSDEEKTRTMNEQVLTIDIVPKSKDFSERLGEQTVWARSDNSFRFNFLQDQDINTCIQNQARPSAYPTEPTTSQLTFTAQGSPFAFNFEIHTEENMDTTETSDATSANKQQSADLGKILPQSSSPPNAPESSKSKKKKKKNGKNKAEGQKQKVQIETTDERESEEAELSLEEQLQRQLDWCIEQLEQGMRSHKGTSKQKEEASRALKTLRSSKAPLVKKRQVMRAVAGDYRQKMEEEKSKQFKLIQNETASAQLRCVSEFPKKSIYHRKAGIKATITDSGNISFKQDTKATSENFVLTPSKEEFRFNFL